MPAELKLRNAEPDAIDHVADPGDTATGLPELSVAANVSWDVPAPTVSDDEATETLLTVPVSSIVPIERVDPFTVAGAVAVPTRTPASPAPEKRIPLL
jgi:hypothetical protein